MVTHAGDLVDPPLDCTGAETDLGCCEIGRIWDRIRRSARVSTADMVEKEAEVSQRDIVARIDRDIDAYERQYGRGCLADTNPTGTPQGSGNDEDDPCGWRTI